MWSKGEEAENEEGDLEAYRLLLPVYESKQWICHPRAEKIFLKIFNKTKK